MERRKSLALIGHGYWGKNLARVFYHLGALHSICEKNPALLEPCKALYPDVHCTDEFEEILQNPLIRQVAIAAPAEHHYRLAKSALLKGKDVFVEKPLCLDIHEGEELIALAQKNNSILMVGHLLQYHPIVRKIQDMIRSGVFGKLQYIVSNRLNLGKIRHEENALWSFAPHDLSVILSLCGSRLPDEVRCVGEAYLSKKIADTSLTMLKFGEDVRAHIYVSWLNPFKEQKLTIIGSKAMAVFDDTKPWQEKLTLFKDCIDWQEGNKAVAMKASQELVHVEEKEPLLAECEHFLHCCEMRQTPRTDGYEGLRVLKVLQAAELSMEEEGSIKVPSTLTSKHSVLQKDYYCHPTAVIDPAAEIGTRVKIWHFSHIMHDSKIGPDCKIGQNVVISPDVTLGCNVKVQNNVSIYTGVICEDDVFLGPSCVFTNVLNPRSQINRQNQYTKTHVRRGATIGANATIICGNELGEYCFIGAGAVVTKSVKPYALIVGNPGKQIGWMSRYGEKLNLPLSLPTGESMEARCPGSGELYRLEGSNVYFAEVKEGAFVRNHETL